MAIDNNFSEMGAKLEEQGSLSQKKVKKNKFVPILFLVLGLLLIFSTSALAYQYFLEKILPCGQSDDGICFELIKNNTAISKYQIKNLDENKNYRLVIKKKIGDSTVDVGTVDLDMNKIKEQRENKVCISRQQSSDSPNISCCDSYEIKSDLWNDASWSQFTCCKPEECAQDGICVANGQTFEDWDKKCDNGKWINYDGTVVSCTDSDGGKNYGVKGRLVKGTFSIEDQCSDDKKLLEVYCEDNELKREFYDCSFGCNDGACVSDPGVAGCTDSDNGKNFYTKGHLIWATQEYEVDDYCDESTGELMEYFCMIDVDMYENVGYVCPNGCSEGACIEGTKKQWGEMCNGNEECEVGYSCKSSARYPTDNDSLYSESYCCKVDECASVIPEGPGSTDSAPHCVLDGGTDQVDTPLGPLEIECSNGEYPDCDHHSKTAPEEGDLSCCGDLVIKNDLWMQSDTSYFNFACCEPDECHQDNICVPNGEDHTVDWGVKCTFGNWEGTLLTY